MTPTLKARLARRGWGGSPTVDVVQHLPVEPELAPPQAWPVLPPPSLPPAGWYLVRPPGSPTEGPADGPYERWWDGAAWTPNVRRYGAA